MVVMNVAHVLPLGGGSSWTIWPLRPPALEEWYHAINKVVTSSLMLTLFPNMCILDALQELSLALLALEDSSGRNPMAAATLVQVWNPFEDTGWERSAR